MSDVTRIRKLYDDLVFAHAKTDEIGGPSLYKLDLLTSIMEAAEQERAELVARARSQGVTWTRIGQTIGTSKQAAQQRYGSSLRGANGEPDYEQLTIDE